MPNQPLTLASHIYLITKLNLFFSLFFFARIKFPKTKTLVFVQLNYILRICISYAVLEIDIRGISPIITTEAKIVHLLFFRSSFWRRCRGLPKYRFLT